MGLISLIRPSSLSFKALGIPFHRDPYRWAPLDRETPTHSSSITEASGLLLWGYPRILALLFPLLLPSRCLLLMFIDATLCLFIFNPHLGHSKTCPSWVSTAYQHLGHSLDVFLGSTEAVNATLTLFYVCFSRVF